MWCVCVWCVCVLCVCVVWMCACVGLCVCVFVLHLISDLNYQDARFVRGKKSFLQVLLSKPYILRRTDGGMLSQLT